MKNNIMLGVLVTMLLLSSLGTLLLAGVNFIAQRQLENGQNRANLIRTTLDSAQRLANDSIRYSQKNPAISAVLTNFQSQARRLRVPATPQTNAPPPDAGGPEETNQPPANP